MKLKKSEKLRRELYQSLLNFFNLKEEFNKLPFDVREAFFKFSWPKLQIEKEEGLDHPFADEVVNNIQEILSDSFVLINHFLIFTSILFCILACVSILVAITEKKLKNIFIILMVVFVIFYKK
jgi:hypothetical protein